MGDRPPRCLRNDPIAFFGLFCRKFATSTKKFYDRAHRNFRILDFGPPPLFDWTPPLFIKEFHLNTPPFIKEIHLKYPPLSIKKTPPLFFVKNDPLAQKVTHQKKKKKKGVWKCHFVHPVHPFGFENRNDFIILWGCIKRHIRAFPGEILKKDPLKS